MFGLPILPIGWFIPIFAVMALISAVTRQKGIAKMSVFIVAICAIIYGWGYVDANAPITLDYLDYLQPTSGFTYANFTDLVPGQMLEPKHLLYAKSANENGINETVRQYTSYEAYLEELAKGILPPKKLVSFSKGDIGYINGGGRVKVVSVDGNMALLMHYEPYQTKELLTQYGIENGEPVVAGQKMVDTGDDVRVFGVTEAGINEFVNGTMFYYPRQKLEQVFFQSD